MCHQLMPSLPDRDGSYYSVAAASSFFRHLLLRDFNYENVTLLGVEGGGRRRREDQGRRNCANYHIALSHGKSIRFRLKRVFFFAPATSSKLVGWRIQKEGRIILSYATLIPS